MTSDILQRLKAETAEAHRQTEKRLPMFDPEFDLRGYARVLEQFYGFWAPLEIELSKAEGVEGPELALRSRLKSHLLEADLRNFGIDPAAVARCSGLPDVGTFVKALGCLYVLEGSTLGSQFIARHLREKFGIGAASGASFFNAYEGEVGARWAAFRAFLTGHATEESADEMIGSAQNTFETLDQWLAR